MGDPVGAAREHRANSPPAILVSGPTSSQDRPEEGSKKGTKREGGEQSAREEQIGPSISSRRLTPEGQDGQGQDQGQNDPRHPPLPQFEPLKRQKRGHCVSPVTSRNTVPGSVPGV